jgi:glucose-6-phosphate dehydrogenase assembly protein OpcA
MAPARVIGTISEIEAKLLELRAKAAEKAGGPALRTSVMTHMAWVPPEWLEAAYGVLEGLAERHPSRTIVLIPEPEAKDGLQAKVSVQSFPLSDDIRIHVCAEVIELRLGGRRTKAPASIVEPLLIPDLPVFLRWRGRPPFGGIEFEELAGVTDRLILDSREWSDGVPGGWRLLAERFERTAVSDICWTRTLPWRRALAGLWPGIAELRELRVRGPRPEALLLHGWLRSRLRRPDIGLVHEEAAELEEVAVDGEPVGPPRGDRLAPSDLLSAELDVFGWDRVYEEAVRAAAEGGAG